MPIATVKQLGDAIRRDLKQAQQAGILPAGGRYDVRASTSKTGPAVNVTISAIENLIPGYPALTSASVQDWLQGDGQHLLQRVERIRNNYNPDPPVYGGATKFGRVYIGASVGGVTTIGGTAA